MIRRTAALGAVVLMLVAMLVAVGPAAGEEDPLMTTDPSKEDKEDYDTAAMQLWGAGESPDPYYGGSSAASEKSGSGVPAQRSLTPEEVQQREMRRTGVGGACLGVDGCAGPSAPGVAASPVVLAEFVEVRVAGMLPEPEVLSNPPPGVASIIHVPVFVEVLNWQPVFTDEECAGSLCVTVTATPELTFDPGEDDSAPVDCVDAGDRYDPDSDLGLEEQAEGACAYIYRKRTGALGRPKAWPGRAIVTWSLSWAATDGTSGSLPSVDKVADLPKSVVEIQAVLVSPDHPSDGN